MHRAVFQPVPSSCFFCCFFFLPIEVKVVSFCFVIYQFREMLAARTHAELVAGVITLLSLLTVPSPTAAAALSMTSDSGSLVKKLGRAGRLRLYENENENVSHAEAVRAARAGTSGAGIDSASTSVVDGGAQPGPNSAFKSARAYTDWLLGIERREKKVFSQFGEDGVIAHLFDTLGTTDKYYVEFGTQDGSETNTRLLREQNGWSGLLLDGGYQNTAINLQRAFITPSSIVSVI